MLICEESMSPISNIQNCSDIAKLKLVSNFLAILEGDIQGIFLCTEASTIGKTSQNILIFMNGKFPKAAFCSYS